MNEISKLANRCNEINDKNNAKKKEPFLIDDAHPIKTLTTLALTPNIKKKYKLNKNQEKFRKGAQLTLAALIASLGITAGVAAYKSQEHGPQEQETGYSAETLDKYNLLNNAEDMLLEYVAGKNDTKKLDVNYRTEKSDGSTFITVSTEFEEILFAYNNGFSIDKYSNSKEILELLDQMIRVHNASEPSEKQLKELAEIIENLDDKQFVLKDNHIVSVGERDNER